MIAKQLVPGLYSIPLGIVNSYLLRSGQEWTLIDTGFDSSHDRLRQALTELRIDNCDLRNIVLTHAHPDHIGSAGRLQHWSGAKVYIHKLDAPIAESGGGFRPLTAAPGMLNRALVAITRGKIITVDPIRVDRLVEDDDVLPIAGGLSVIHMPGHCAGQVAILWPQYEGVLFVADVCMHFAGLHYSVGYENFEQGERDMQRLTNLDFDKACFGHGSPISSGASQVFRRKFRT
jgi:glyoxylase-like metal-dependent hydrolase (beta-lactamase superfamily II)